MEVLLAHGNDETTMCKLSLNSLEECLQTGAAKLVQKALITSACATEFLMMYEKFSMSSTSAASITGFDQ